MRPGFGEKRAGPPANFDRPEESLVLIDTMALGAVGNMPAVVEQSESIGIATGVANRKKREAHNSTAAPDAAP